MVRTTSLSLNAAPTSSSNGLRAMAGCSFASILRAWLNLQNVPQVQHCPAHVFQQLILRAIQQGLAGPPADVATAFSEWATLTTADHGVVNSSKCNFWSPSATSLRHPSLLHLQSNADPTKNVDIKHVNRGIVLVGMRYSTIVEAVLGLLLGCSTITYLVHRTGIYTTIHVRERASYRSPEPNRPDRTGLLLLLQPIPIGGPIFP